MNAVVTARAVEKRPAPGGGLASLRPASTTISMLLSSCRICNEQNRLGQKIENAVEVAIFLFVNLKYRIIFSSRQVIVSFRRCRC